MILKITKLYILCGNIQVSTERKNSLVLKWFQRWQNHAFFVETFIFQLKTQFSTEMILKIKELYILCGTFKSQPKNTVYFEMITNMKDPYILCWGIQNSIDRTLHLCWDNTNSSGKSSSVSNWFQRWQNLTSFVGTFKFQLKKTVQYWNDRKDCRTLHPLRGDSDPIWKKQFSIEMITKMTETNILCGDISIPNWRRQFSIEIIPKIQIPIDRTLHLLLGHSNSNMKNSSVLEWFQRSHNFTSFVEAFKSQLKKTV